MRDSVRIVYRLLPMFRLKPVFRLLAAFACLALIPATIPGASAATTLPAVDAALAAQASDQAHKDWNQDAELVQITATTTTDGVTDMSHPIPVTFFFRVGDEGYQMTLSRDGEMLGAQAPLPPQAIEALPIQFISLKDALALARAKGFSQTGTLHPVLQSFASTDGLRRIGWLFAAPGDPPEKQIFIGAEGHLAGSVLSLFGSLRQ